MRLLIKTAPHIDEALPGYALRLCGLNDYNHPKWLMNQPSTAIYNWISSLTFASRISELAETSLDLVKHHTYLLDEQRFNRILGHRISPVFISLRTAKICPQCLTERISAPFYWDVFFTVRAPFTGFC